MTSWNNIWLEQMTTVERKVDMVRENSQVYGDDNGLNLYCTMMALSG